LIIRLLKIIGHMQKLYGSQWAGNMILNDNNETIPQQIRHSQSEASQSLGETD
jgi:hypothetical protein